MWQSQHVSVEADLRWASASDLEAGSHSNDSNERFDLARNDTGQSQTGNDTGQSQTSASGEEAKHESRCFATTRFECVDCATALALRDAIRKVATTLQSRRRSSVFEGNHYESTSSLLPKVSEGEGGVEELGELLEDCLDVEFEKGQTILEEGSWNRTLYMVTSGFALARASNGKVLVRRGPGEMFGEVSFYGSGNRGAGCSVLAGARATTVKTLDAAYLARCRAADPMREARIHRWVAGNIAQRVQTQVVFLSFRVARDARDRFDQFGV
ncbi:hypothetical protein T484DRAFT_2560881 [Baffinella frigidus]|nr:hypothetical protein T484DRAFT_2560881 [Cryptophyta sp. CCMP2293]